MVAFLPRVLNNFLRSAKKILLPMACRTNGRCNSRWRKITLMVRQELILTLMRRRRVILMNLSPLFWRVIQLLILVLLIRLKFRLITSVICLLLRVIFKFLTIPRPVVGRSLGLRRTLPMLMLSPLSCFSGLVTMILRR